MQNFHLNEQILMEILKKKLDPELYDYAEKELARFYTECYEVFDARAVHTDREGQPRLIKYNRFGEDVSEVWVNEGYKQTVQDTYNAGIVGYVHKNIPELKRPGNYLYSYAQGYLLSQVEPGFYCPVTLTMAVAYLIDQFASEALKEKFLPHILATGETELYEGATFLTERQGGSDVGANEVKAVQEGDYYRLYGEKYFASNAGQCGVAAVLARMEGAKPGTKGLSLFLVPWKKDNGTVNNIQVRRLKDKLGVRAVPSAEVVLEGSKAYLVGDPAKGFYYMMEALNLSRVCNAVASLGIMKRALEEAHAYANWRESFGQKIVQFPMVQETLSNLQARFEIQLEGLFESIELYNRVMLHRETTSQQEIVLNRLLIALIKARTASEAIDFSHKAIELHGGNGYIEDFVTPRLLRDAQVLTVWEGTENILGLEVLRLIKKYRVHELFIGKMQKEMEGCHGTEDQNRHIHAQLKELMEMLEFLEDKDDSTQTYHAKRVADYMTNIYFAVCSMSRASDDRKKYISQIYMKHIFESHKLDKEMIGVHYFDIIMNSKLNVTN